MSDLSAGEVALGSLLDASHRLHPDDVGKEVARRAAMVGAAGAVLWVVDRQQRVLTRLDDHSQTLEVNSSLAGRAYRTGAVVLAEDGRRACFPLLDGTERVGVLTAELASTDAVTMVRCRQLASLAAELIVTKRAYGDGPVLAERRREMDVSAEMRWALMPPLTFATDVVTLAGALEPAYEIAGDTFDYSASGDTLHFAVFDAMGHGLWAARMANLAVVAYRNARRHGLGLVETLAFVQDTVVEQFGAEATFVTAHLGRLSMGTGRLSLLNAGHPRPLLLRGMRSVSEVPCDRGLPIGVAEVEERTAVVTELPLEPGDGVLFYSDGVTEARSPEGEEFGEERLADFLVRAAASGETPSEMMRRLTHAVLEHQNDRLDDDATLLIIHWSP
ncbi:MAG TPA: PP2C family protein-serine/threonine phosphatase [Acidimicrobiales bacterium]|jgi:hypothetical protein|nr:PP2C family protein-serine/threonine phosphatase [Acidimicrobiales bacterium]